ncbi:MAG: hypothetical protein HY656_00685 [Acidobacteria bacterium]|nr:hypothetical protein [Acidobacteriota bacterium]
MDLEEAYKKLMERHQEVQEKLAALAALAEEVATAQHQFRRVEMEKFEELNQALEATLEDYSTARRRFGRALQGD